MSSHMTWHVNRCSHRRYLTMFCVVLCSVMWTQTKLHSCSALCHRRWTEREGWRDGGIQRKEEGNKVREEAVIGRKEKRPGGGLRDQSVKGCAPRPVRAKLHLCCFDSCLHAHFPLSTSTPSRLSCLLDFFELCAFTCKPGLSRLHTEVGRFPLEQHKREAYYCWCDKFLDAEQTCT